MRCFIAPYSHCQSIFYVSREVMATFKEFFFLKILKIYSDLKNKKFYEWNNKKINQIKYYVRNISNNVKVTGIFFVFFLIFIWFGFENYINAGCVRGSLIGQSVWVATSSSLGSTFSDALHQEAKWLFTSLNTQIDHRLCACLSKEHVEQYNCLSCLNILLLFWVTLLLGAKWRNNFTTFSQY